MSLGGSIQGFGFAGRSFASPADSQPSVKLGGAKNDVQANGDGSARIISTIELPMLSGGAVDIDSSTDDHEFLQDLCDSKVFFAFTFTYQTGVTYQGRVQITELDSQPGTATANFTVVGEGEFVKQ